MHTKKFQHDAFTLVEICMVLAVVGLLAALLFPVVSRARAGARTSTCAANLRQIGQALAIYKSDYDDFYPPCVTRKPSDGNSKKSGVWWMTLNLKPMPTCPDVDLNWEAQDPRVRQWISGYASNYNLTQNFGSRIKPNQSGRAESAVRYPALTVAAFDARPLINGLREPDMLNTLIDMKRASRPPGFDNKILQLPPAAQRHQGRANYLFGDGHVKWFRPEELSTTRQNDGVHPGFGL